MILINKMYRYLASELIEYSVQIFIYFLFKTVKILGLKSIFDSRYILNEVMIKRDKCVKKLIDNRVVDFTEDDNIMYKQIIPEIDKYPSKTILFVGGRNSFMLNYEFCSMVTQKIGVKTICFQYEGINGSGKQNYLCHNSYIRAVEKIYNKFSSTTDLYVIGYSMGSYGAFYVNKKDKLMLISPFYSLKKAVHDIIDIDGFCLNSLLPHKPHVSVEIHAFYFDFITFFTDLKDNFIRDNIKINKHYGHHITGITEYILPFIEEYLNK